MKISKPQLAFISLSICCLSATSSFAAESLNPGLESSSINSQSSSIQIAQDFSLCSDSESDYVPRVWAETRDFLVNICYYFEGGSPIYYGQSKKTGASISVSVQEEGNNRYVAVNGNVRYILTRNELVVMQGRKTLLRQKVLRFRRR